MFLFSQRRERRRDMTIREVRVCDASTEVADFEVAVGFINLHGRL